MPERKELWFARLKVLGNIHVYGMFLVGRFSP